jgi:uncharacterized protein YuzE
MAQRSQQAVGIQCDYQPEVDLLYAWIGEPEAAENIEVEPGIYVRVSPVRRQVIGIEVLDCSARFHREPSSIDAPFAERLIAQYSQAALAEFARISPPTLFSSEP